MSTNPRHLELLAKAQRGCIESRNLLVTENMGFIVSVIKQYTGRGEPPTPKDRRPPHHRVLIAWTGWKRPWKGRKEEWEPKQKTQGGFTASCSRPTGQQRAKRYKTPKGASRKSRLRRWLMSTSGKGQDASLSSVYADGGIGLCDPCRGKG